MNDAKFDQDLEAAKKLHEEEELRQTENLVRLSMSRERLRADRRTFRKHGAGVTRAPHHVRKKRKKRKKAA